MSLGAKPRRSRKLRPSGSPLSGRRDRLRSRLPASRARHRRCARPHGVAHATPAPTPISRGGPVTLPKSAGGVTAVKFRDPEGHPLEFLQFPPGANPDWKGAGVMGIDHSAISVSDVAASRRFYARHGLSEAERDAQSRPDAGRARRPRRRRGRCRADEPCRQAAACRDARLPPSRRAAACVLWPPTTSPPPASSGGRTATR